MSATFFFNRLQRAVQMDSTNEVLGRDCFHIIEATAWKDAFYGSLDSKNKRDAFDKEWRKCELDLAAARKFADFGKK